MLISLAIGLVMQIYECNQSEKDFEASRLIGEQFYPSTIPLIITAFIFLNMTLYWVIDCLLLLKLRNLLMGSNRTEQEGREPRYHQRVVSNNNNNNQGGGLSNTTRGFAGNKMDDSKVINNNSNNNGGGGDGSTAPNIRLNNSDNSSGSIENAEWTELAHVFVAISVIIAGFVLELAYDGNPYNYNADSILFQAVVVILFEFSILALSPQEAKLETKLMWVSSCSCSCDYSSNW